MNRNRPPPLIVNGINDLQDLTRWVKALQPQELSLFDKLYTGVETPKTAKKLGNFDENRFSTIKDIVESTSDEKERASRLINLVYRLENDIKQIINDGNAFQRTETEQNKNKQIVENKFIAIFDAALLIKEANDFKIIDGNKAEQIIEKYAKWEFQPSISTKLPEFQINDDGDYDYSNVGFNQQLCGKIPPSPIAHQIHSFSLLNWQKNMFDKLKDGFNVICCAPTSSGKTMIALGFIYTFLKYRPKSLLVYFAPNNVLAMEVSAILNKYVPNLVSTLLDESIERKMNERVVVCTPTGAFTHGFILEHIPSDSFLVVDEVHCISNKNGINMEYCLRKFSYVQTLILSATMTLNTIHKLKDSIRNSLETHEINESTRFMIPQYMIPKLNSDDNITLASLNPVGSITYQDLSNENLDIPMTPRDIYSLFVKISKVFGKDMPEYLHPIRFFFIHHSRKPSSNKKISEVLDDESSGEIRRLSLDDFAVWQKAIFEFLSELPSDIEHKIIDVIDSYKLSLTDESTCQCTLDNAFKLVEKIKDENMLQALFFFPNACRAFKYASHIYKKLSEKPVSNKAIKIDKEKELKIEALKKQLESLERIKLKRGADVKDIKERKYQLRNEISALQNSSSSVQAQHSLSEVLISEEDFNKLVISFKKWNSNIIQSSPLVQMVVYGIGVLSGDMPQELQVLIRKLYTSNVLTILMVTEDCAYGINTPTKTVILSDGFTESQRRQMAGRAGRKGLSTNAWVIYFRLQSPEEAGQKLTDIIGNEVILTTNNKIPNENKWISKIKRIDYPYVLNDEQISLSQSFFHMTKLVFQHAAVMAPVVVDLIIKKTEGQTNRHITAILAIISLTPFNKPFHEKNGWGYEFPNEVKKIMIDNGFEIIPNYAAYLWLTNQSGELSIEQQEQFVEMSKYWSYLFLLLKINFPEKEMKLYQQIQDILIVSMIRTSITI